MRSYKLSWGVKFGHIAFLLIFLGLIISKIISNPVIDAKLIVLCVVFFVICFVFGYKNKTIYVEDDKIIISGMTSVVIRKGELKKVEEIKKMLSLHFDDEIYNLEPSEFNEGEQLRGDLLKFANSPKD